jgi:hypothetical protein
MNKINQEDILLFRDTVNTQAPVDKDGVSRIHKLERKPPFTQLGFLAHSFYYQNDSLCHE